MIDYFKLALSRYADFSGRSRRSEYWYFILAQMVLFMVLFMVVGLLFAISETLGFIAYGVVMLLSLALIVPGLAVAIRRLHDIGKSGWYLLVGLIPFVGGIILLVWMATEGERGENEYGLDPKSPEAEKISRNLIEDDLV